MGIGAIAIRPTPKIPDGAAPYWSKKPLISGTTRVLVDTSPDLRMQLIDAGIGEVDGVIYTHEHADHTHGVDDLRQIAFNTRNEQMSI